MSALPDVPAPDTPATAEHGDRGRSRPPRRGRRPGGGDTREALLEAARAEFGERGYDGATVRAIAERAGVDPAMVNHGFGGKEALFAAALDLPIDLEQIASTVLHAPRDELGERVIRAILGVWDDHPDQITALLRSITSNEAAAMMMRQFITSTVLGPLATRLDVDRPELRAALCGSQVVGVAMTRFVLKLDPIAQAAPATIVAALGPTLQRYLTGPLDAMV